MIKTLKIILTVISSLFFLGFIFFTAFYYIDGLFYLHYSKKSIIYSLLCILVLGILTFLFILLIIKTFKSKNTKEYTLSLLIITPVIFYIMVMRMIIGTIGGIYGCSYTENIENYRKVDHDVTIPSYFPKNITDDMTVVKYTYYHKQIECCNTDLYLEVKFNDLSTMETYISNHKQPNEGKEVIEYQNPYNDKYTDIFKGKYYANDDFDFHNNYVIFNPSGSIQINYETVSYSYEELTIIYNYTKIYDDIYVGDHKEKGNYYPKFLERFNVESINENEFFLNDVID